MTGVEGLIQKKGNDIINCRLWWGYVLIFPEWTTRIIETECNFQNSRQEKRVSDNAVHVKDGSKGEGNRNSDGNKSGYVNTVTVSGLTSAAKDKDHQALQRSHSHPWTLLHALTQGHTFFSIVFVTLMCQYVFVWLLCLLILINISFLHQTTDLMLARTGFMLDPKCIPSTRRTS